MIFHILFYPYYLFSPFIFLAFLVSAKSVLSYLPLLQPASVYYQNNILDITTTAGIAGRQCDGRNVNLKPLCNARYICVAITTTSVFLHLRKNTLNNAQIEGKMCPTPDEEEPEIAVYSCFSCICHINTEMN